MLAPALGVIIMLCNYDHINPTGTPLKYFCCHLIYHPTTQTQLFLRESTERVLEEARAIRLRDAAAMIQKTVSQGHN